MPPLQYEKIRDSYVKRGVPLKKAKSIAAATYNSQHPGHPMRPGTHGHFKCGGSIKEHGMKRGGKTKRRGPSPGALAALAAAAGQGGGGPPPGMGPPPGPMSAPPGMAKGGGVERKGKMHTKMVKMAGGGAVRGGGCETKGKTRGKFV